MHTWTSRSALVWPAVGLLVAVLALAETLIDDSLRLGLAGALPGLAVGLLLALGSWRLEPATVLGALTTLPNVLVGAPGPGGAQLIGIGLLVGHATAALPGRRGLWTAAVAAVVLLAVGIAFAPNPWEALFYLAVVGAAAAVGLLVRRSRERAQELAVLAARLAEQQDTVAAAAAVAERARIAREVHDSVAHSVSVMVLQMGGLRRLLPDHPGAQEVLLGLERLGRESVEEMRRVVGILRERPDGAPAPQPSLSRLDAVLAELRAAGLPVELEVTGTPVPLPPLVDVSAVRVVQEALSNVLRHAGAAATRVQVAHTPSSVSVTVTDDGRARVAASADPVPAAPGGHGQLHMRERVAVAGGTLQVGPVTGGGYRVRAVFPVPTAGIRTPATAVRA